MCHNHRSPHTLEPMFCNKKSHHIDMCVLAWIIPGTGEPVGLPSMGSHRVGHNCHDLAAAAAADMCTPVFIAALFTIARTWNQPRYPSADEWIRKLWYICTMEYYSAIKKNAIESVLMRWMKLEPTIQSEVSQKEKHQYSILMHIYNIYRI